jgi:hypothetical protein
MNRIRNERLLFVAVKGAVGEATINKYIYIHIHTFIYIYIYIYIPVAGYTAVDVYPWDCSTSHLSVGWFLKEGV